ncbi:MAG: hypothetical protein QME45_06265 [Clostridiales bacterium]|nr:hypothetical protein [Clostridiales bacterium]
MLPDVIGLRLNDGIIKLNKSGILDKNIEIINYDEPGNKRIGNEVRIIRLDKHSEKIKLIVGYF